MGKEIWKDIIEYEGLYQVSNHGRVRSLDRVINGRWEPRKMPGVILKEVITEKGYSSFSLYKAAKAKIKRAHALVAAAFVDNPNELPMVNHKDEIKSNNYYLNLEWVNGRQNINYSANKHAVSKYPGVFWRKNRGVWIASCYMNKKSHYLEYFHDELEAAQAYVDFCNKNNLNYSV